MEDLDILLFLPMLATCNTCNVMSMMLRARETCEGISIDWEQYTPIDEYTEKVRIVI